jgi:hypothetical protein
MSQRYGYMRLLPKGRASIASVSPPDVGRGFAAPESA